MKYGTTAACAQNGNSIWRPHSSITFNPFRDYMQIIQSIAKILNILFDIRRMAHLKIGEKNSPKVIQFDGKQFDAIALKKFDIWICLGN